MTGSARVRISKITPKNGGAIVSILPTRPAPDETVLVDTLVHLLDQARRGRVVGYAFTFTVEREDDWKTVEGAFCHPDHDSHYILGAMRRMEKHFIARTWPEDGAA